MILEFSFVFLSNSNFCFTFFTFVIQLSSSHFDWTKQVIRFRFNFMLSNFMIIISSSFHCLKNVHYQSFSGPHFPVFGLNTETYPLNLRIQSECRKMRTRISPNTNTFYKVFSYFVSLYKLLLLNIF